MIDTSQFPPRPAILKPALLLLALTLLLLLAPLYIYKIALQFSALRTDCLIGLIIAPLGASLTLAGIIHLLDHALTPPQMPPPSPPPKPRPWYLRVTLSELKRLLLALQLLTTSLSLAAALILLFHFPLPELMTR